MAKLVISYMTNFNKLDSFVCVFAGSDTIRRMVKLKGVCSTVPFRMTFAVTEKHVRVTDESLILDASLTANMYCYVIFCCVQQLRNHPTLPVVVIIIIILCLF